MITFGRRGGALLTGLTSGVLLVGSLTVAAPVGVLPAGWQAALGPTPVASTASAPAVAAPTAVPLAATPSAAPVKPVSTTPPTPTSAPEKAPTTAPTTTVRPPPTTTRRPVPAAPSGPAATVVALTNDARAEAGCAPLRPDARLTVAAQGHSEDMSAGGYFSHDSRDGRSFADRIENAGYPSPGAENIAQGQRSAAEVMRAWLNSPGHRRNIEDCSLTTIGVGLAGEDFYWTQDFGR